VLILVIVVGLVLTGALTFTAVTLNNRNEHRLLEVHTRQAGAVIQASILGITDPLSTALQIELATGGNTTQFTTFMDNYVGKGRSFVSASLWDASGASPTVLVRVGVRPALAPSSAQAARLMRRARVSSTFSVAGIPDNMVSRIAYAEADPSNRSLVVYAERAIPPSRRVPVESNSAFDGLSFATYLGRSERTSELATTDVPLSALPLTGNTATVVVPFGDSVVTLVAAAQGQLGGSFGLQLPWVFFIGGLLVTALGAVAAEELVRRRRTAAEDSFIISGLYHELGQLYGEQRSIAEELQRALLPLRNPDIADLEIASTYVAGAVGVDVGGDWYSIIGIDESTFGFVVGDVSGRGVSAATVMARLRYTIRAYLVEGHAPEVALDLCARQVDLKQDGHFATVLVGVGDIAAHTVTVANAGHLPPLLIEPAGASFVPTHVNPPLGVATDPFVATTFTVPAHSSLLAFTDGLVERRGEMLDAGMARLARVAEGFQGSLDELVSMVLRTQIEGSQEDDVALLAFRWTDATTIEVS
jgi:serine phosphatase RsbU (regulator of sigma subunit)